MSTGWSSSAKCFTMHVMVDAVMLVLTLATAAEGIKVRVISITGLYERFTKFDTMN